jgi:GT2 family glycosyltransferase
VCVLLYGDYLPLAERVISSISAHCPRQDYSLIVGANAVTSETLRLLEFHQEKGTIDRLVVSETNLNKCPMMRLMFEEVESEFIWWFDDDSYITESSALSSWLRRAQASPESTVMWGQLASCDHRENFTYLKDPVGFVREAAWYASLPPPSWRPGGKGEFNHDNKGTGDGRWFFITGGCWMIRSSAVRALDWPDRRLVKMGDDVFLGEAIRQQGWQLENLGTFGVTISTERRRGSLG